MTESRPEYDGCAPNQALDRMQPDLNQIGISHIWQLACAPDGLTLALATSCGLYFCSPLTLEPTAIYPVGTKALCFSPDSSLVIAACGNEIHMVRVLDGQMIRCFKTAFAAISRIALNAAGDLLAVLHDHSTVTIWSLPGGNVQTSFTMPTPENLPISDLAFHPEGHVLALGMRDEIMLWDLIRSEQTFYAGENIRHLRNIRFDPAGTVLVATVANKNEVDSGKATQEWVCWQVQAKEPEAGESGSEVLQLRWGGSWGPLALSESYPSVEEQEVALTNELAYSSDGQWLAVAEGNPSFGGKILLYPQDDRSVDVWIDDYNFVQAVGLAFIPQSTYLAIAGFDDLVSTWDIVNAQLLQRRSFGTGRRSSGFDVQVTARAVHPTGELVAIGYQNAAVRLWRISDGTLLRTMEAGIDWRNNDFDDIVSLEFSPGGNVLAAIQNYDGGDNTGWVWWTESGKLAMRLGMIEGEGIQFISNDVLFYEGLDQFVLARISDGSPLWISPTGALRTLFAPHEQGEPINSIRERIVFALSPDRTRFAVWQPLPESGEWGFSLWDALDGLRLGTFETPGPLRQKPGFVEFSPQNRWFGVCEGKYSHFTQAIEEIGAVYFWEVASQRFFHMVVLERTPNQISFLSDDLVFITYPRQIFIRQVEDWSLVRIIELEMEASSVLLTSDRSAFITFDKQHAWYWRVSDGQLLEKRPVGN